jgi:hypothetical protein
MIDGDSRSSQNQRTIILFHHSNTSPTNKELSLNFLLFRGNPSVFPVHVRFENRETLAILHQRKTTSSYFVISTQIHVLVCLFTFQKKF